MANDLNLCQFIGRIGKDPESRFMPSGDQITSFSLAVGSQWKDKSGEKQESTEWINCVVFGKQAEIASKYLVKGTQVYVSGRMKTDKYQDKSGVDKYVTKIIVERFQMIGGKQQGNSTQQQNNAPKSQYGGRFDDLEEDLPF